MKYNVWHVGSGGEPTPVDGARIVVDDAGNLHVYGTASDTSEPVQENAVFAATKWSAVIRQP